MEDRYQRGSTVIISQLPVSEWYKLVSNPRVADVLLDRLLHNGHRVELNEESMRKPIRRIKNLIKKPAWKA
ncbi:DNA replication protein DnaC [Pantoea sp. SORGH_AS 659]|nr:DNA replication protein DnaC [Pantoea sp. SORGH_AS_0659]